MKAHRQEPVATFIGKKVGQAEICKVGRGRWQYGLVMEPHRKGELTEAVVIAELKRRSIPVALPFGDNERYDAVIESPDGNLLKIQIKTGRLTDGKIEFHGKSQHTNSAGNVYKRYEGDVDYFIVYCDEIEEMYLIKEDSFGESISLRVEQPEQIHNTINWAEDYGFDSNWPPNQS